MALTGSPKEAKEVAPSIQRFEKQEGANLAYAILLRQLRNLARTKLEIGCKQTK